MKWRFVAWVLASIFFVGCQLKPTKVTETYQIDIGPLVQGLRRPLLIDKDTIVIDVRSPFDYAMAHIPNSINLQWQEFAKHRSKNPGELEDDRFKMARRLARLGIQPSSKVVVVGSGLSGQGEEGRMAWTLFYLGVHDVHMASIDYFKAPLTTKSSEPRPSAPYWQPQLSPSVLATKAELLKAITKQGAPEPEKIHLIDVRSQKEYFRKEGFGLDYAEPDLQAINIEWREFFDSYGRPNPSIKERLIGVGIKPSDRVIVISNQGVRAAAVTMALLSLGYDRAANYPYRPH